MKKKTMCKEMDLFETQNEQSQEKKEAAVAVKEPAKAATVTRKAKREPRPVQPTLFDNYDWSKK